MSEDFLDSIVDFLLETISNPGKAIGRLWIAWWIWSSIRKAYKRISGKDKPTEQPAPVEAAPAPKPVASPPLPASPQASRPQASGPQASTMQPRRLQGTEPSASRAAASRAAASRKPPRTEPRWGALVERAEEVRLQLLRDNRLRWAEPVLVSEVIAPLQEARKRDTDPQQLPPRTAGAVLALQLLERRLENNAAEPSATVLTVVDAVAKACQQPLVDYTDAEDIAWFGRTPLSVRGHVEEGLHARGLTRELLPLGVRPAVGTHLNDYAKVVHGLGQRWVTALPGLLSQLQTRLSLPPQMRLVDVRQGYDERMVYASFGPWLPALCADILLTLRLGNGYVTVLRREVIAAGDKATRASHKAGMLSADPPPLLRLHAALLVLDMLGRHDDVHRHQALVADALDDTSHCQLPLAGGSALTIGSDYLLALTEDITRNVLEVRAPALGGVSLSQWPGLSQTLEDAHEQVLLSQTLNRSDAPAGTDAAQLLSAAWLAWDAGGDPQVLLARLHKALAPRQKVAAKVEVLAEKPRPRSLHAAFRDRATIRAAIVLGAELGSRTGSRTHSRRA